MSNEKSKSVPTTVELWLDTSVLSSDSPEAVLLDVMREHGCAINKAYRFLVEVSGKERLERISGDRIHIDPAAAQARRRQALALFPAYPELEADVDWLINRIETSGSESYTSLYTELLGSPDANSKSEPESRLRACGVLPLAYIAGSAARKNVCAQLMGKFKSATKAAESRKAEAAENVEMAAQELGRMGIDVNSKPIQNLVTAHAESYEALDPSARLSRRVIETFVKGGEGPSEAALEILSQDGVGDYLKSLSRQEVRAVFNYAALRRKASKPYLPSMTDQLPEFADLRTGSNIFRLHLPEITEPANGFVASLYLGGNRKLDLPLMVSARHTAVAKGRGRDNRGVVYSIRSVPAMGETVVKGGRFPLPYPSRAGVAELPETRGTYPQSKNQGHALEVGSGERLGRPLRCYVAEGRVTMKHGHLCVMLTGHTSCGVRANSPFFKVRDQCLNDAKNKEAKAIEARRDAGQKGEAAALKAEEDAKAAAARALLYGVFTHDWKSESGGLGALSGWLRGMPSAVVPTRKGSKWSWKTEPDTITRHTHMLQNLEGPMRVMAVDVGENPGAKVAIVEVDPRSAGKVLAGGLRARVTDVLTATIGPVIDQGAFHAFRAPISRTIVCPDGRAVSPASRIRYVTNRLLSYLGTECHQKHMESNRKVRLKRGLPEQAPGMGGTVEAMTADEQDAFEAEARQVGITLVRGDYNGCRSAVSKRCRKMFDGLTTARGAASYNRGLGITTAEDFAFLVALDEVVAIQKGIQGKLFGGDGNACSGDLKRIGRLREDVAAKIAKEIFVLAVENDVDVIGMEGLKFALGSQHENRRIVNAVYTRVADRLARNCHMNGIVLIDDIDPVMTSQLGDDGEQGYRDKVEDKHKLWLVGAMVNSDEQATRNLSGRLLGGEQRIDYLRCREYAPDQFVPNLNRRLAAHVQGVLGLGEACVIKEGVMVAATRKEYEHARDSATGKLINMTRFEGKWLPHDQAVAKVIEATQSARSGDELSKVLGNQAPLGVQPPRAPKGKKKAA